MDATSAYIDAPSTVLSRVGSGLEYLKNVIRESFSRDNVANMSAAATMQSGDQRRFFFPRFEGISGPPPPLPSSTIGSSGDVIANSTLRQFLSTHNRQILSILSKLLGVSISAITTYFLLKWLMKSIDPTNADKMAAKSRAEAIMKQLGVDPKTEELNEYEMVIASNIILPNQIDCSWEDIGGLDHLADELRETVIYPLRDFDLDKDVSNTKTKSAASNNNPTTSNSSNQPSTSIQTRRSKLVQPPKGVLLFGPPGNAKTMIAKALAKESGARFINLQVSTLFDKWFGESQKRTEAVFSLARKVQPAIIFIDEIDSFLRSRRIDDHECTSTMKTQFMTLWDGLTTSNQKQNRILIIGATNRPEDVDPAILRRMPQMFHIGLPNEVQRINILKVILKDENLAEDVNLDEIASRAAQFSGSDLHELCRCAAMNSFIESVRNAKKRDQSENVTSSSSSSPTTHAIRKVDFDVAFEKVAVKVVAMNMNLRDRMDFNF